MYHLIFFVVTTKWVAEEQGEGGIINLLEKVRKTIRKKTDSELTRLEKIALRLTVAGTCALSAVAISTESATEDAGDYRMPVVKYTQEVPAEAEGCEGRILFNERAPNRMQLLTLNMSAVEDPEEFNGFVDALINYAAAGDGTIYLAGFAADEYRLQSEERNRRLDARISELRARFVVSAIIQRAEERGVLLDNLAYHAFGRTDLFGDAEQNRTVLGSTIRPFRNPHKDPDLLDTMDAEERARYSQDLDGMLNMVPGQLLRTRTGTRLTTLVSRGAYEYMIMQDAIERDSRAQLGQEEGSIPSSTSPDLRLLGRERVAEQHPAQEETPEEATTSDMIFTPEEAEEHNPSPEPVEAADAEPEESREDTPASMLSREFLVNTWRQALAVLSIEEPAPEPPPVPATPITTITAVSPAPTREHETYEIRVESDPAPTEELRQDAEPTTTGLPYMSSQARRMQQIYVTLNREVDSLRQLCGHYADLSDEIGLLQEELEQVSERSRRSRDQQRRALLTSRMAQMEEELRSPEARACMGHYSDVRTRLTTLETEFDELYSRFDEAYSIAVESTDFESIGTPEVRVLRGQITRLYDDISGLANRTRPLDDH